MFVNQNSLLSYFSDRLTFSNIRCRTSRRMYRLTLPRCTPEMLSSFSNQGFPYYPTWCPYIYIYICLWSKKKFESYFRDRLTFSNVDSRTSGRIYRLALLLRAPETLSSLSKSRISIFNAHLTLLVRKMTSHNSIGKYRHLVN